VAADLEISTNRGAIADVIRVEGEVDLTNADVLDQSLSKALRTSRPIIADLSRLSFIDLRGTAVLETVGRRAQEDGQQFIVVGSEPHIHILFSIIQLHRRIHVVGTIDEAREQGEEMKKKQV